MPRDMVQVRRGRTHGYEGPDVRLGRSQFNRSHERKMTFDASYLYPIFVDEIYPGDTHTLSLDGFVRIFSPLESPIMDNITLETFFFFVPNRLVWDNWEYFNGAHDAAGAQDTTYTVPKLDTGTTVDHDNSGVALANYAAYFGIPHGLQTGQVDVNALPFRGVNLIYNEFFRDQNLIDELAFNTNDGPDPAGHYKLRKSGKKHDYFTSALPYLIKGDAVYSSLIGSIEVRHNAADNADLGVWSDVNAAYMKMDSNLGQVDASTTAGGSPERLYVNLSNAAAGVDLNGLRNSLAIQRVLEKDARGGTRYTELIKSHFGVTSPDYRLQRPEYLGGGKSWIQVTPVANTSATATENQAELRGIGTGRVSGHGWAKSFTEHGYVIGLMRARGDVTYFQGLDRMWSRQSRYDFYLPDLANLPEQAILNKELYIQNAAADDNTFGYQERWHELRTKKSEVVGVLNPDVTGAISQWHLAEDFGTPPALNQTFVEDQTPMSRVETVTTEPDFLAHIGFNYRSARVLPVRSIPSLMTLRF